MHRRLIPDVISGEPPVPAIGAAEPARLAAERMEGNHVSALIVLNDSDRLAGIVTERDLVRRVMAPGADPEAVCVGEVMTADPDVLAPNDSLLDALALMTARGWRHLPVVNSDGVAVGLVSQDDLLAALGDAVDVKLAETERAVFGA